MNGRMYDPMMHRFLSPDNYIQNPYDTRSYDRFGYVWNNPLMLTDPSGEFIETAALALQTLKFITAAFNLYNLGNNIFGWGNYSFTFGPNGQPYVGGNVPVNNSTPFSGGIKNVFLSNAPTGGSFWSGRKTPQVSTVNEITTKGIQPFETQGPQGGDLSGLRRVQGASNPYSINVNGRELNPGNYQLNNPILRAEVKSLYKGLVNDLGHNNFEFQVTGGDRYHLNGGNYSSTNNDLVTLGDKTAHNIEIGARAVDLRIRQNNGNNLSYLKVQNAIKSTGGNLFYDLPKYVPSFYADGHHHLQLPNRAIFWFQ